MKRPQDQGLDHFTGCPVFSSIRKPYYCLPSRLWPLQSDLQQSEPCFRRRVVLGDVLLLGARQMSPPRPHARTRPPSTPHTSHLPIHPLRMTAPSTLVSRPAKSTRHDRHVHTLPTSQSAPQTPHYTHSISSHRPLNSTVALLHIDAHCKLYPRSDDRVGGPGRTPAVLARLADDRVRLLPHHAGGGLRAWDEPSTAKAIAAKRVHDFLMSHTACAAHCAALKGCTHFELNMYDQPAHSNQGVCSVFASGGYSVTTACKDSSGRPRMHCFAKLAGGEENTRESSARLQPSGRCSSRLPATRHDQFGPVVWFSPLHTSQASA